MGSNKYGCKLSSWNNRSCWPELTVRQTALCLPNTGRIMMTTTQILARSYFNQVLRAVICGTGSQQNFGSVGKPTVPHPTTKLLGSALTK